MGAGETAEGGAAGWEEDLTCQGSAQMIPRTLLSWALEFFNSLPRNMFPANLVEATFKQVSGSLDNRGRAGRASLGPAGK